MSASEFGCNRQFHIDKKAKKHVLITGAGSYIGESFAAYAREYYPNIWTHSLSLRGEAWKQQDFSQYDAVFHVAGKAHADVGHVSEAVKAEYYQVNTTLAIETAKKAKAEGVSQFLFMSSMIIYGDSAPYGREKLIDGHTRPHPSNFYGDSKWQADQGIRKLADESFHTAILRCPMIYGPGSKGNYPMLAKLAKKLPVFPDVQNQRSMLYIGNLCEFLCQLILSGEGGIYFPQNGEYTRTSDMVQLIGKAAGKKVRLVKLLNPAVMLAGHIPGKLSGLVNKAFGNCTYTPKISQCPGLQYQKYTLAESIRKTEGNTDTSDMEESADRKEASANAGNKKPHLLVISQYFHPETFRINDMACEWVKRGYQVTVLTGIPNYPMGKIFPGYGYRKKRREEWNGIDIIRIPLIPRGNSKNKLLSSIGMAANYLSFVVSGFFWNLKTDVRANLVFSYEVSPMTQVLIGCRYAKKHKVPHFLYVQDLWPENVETVTGIHHPIVIGPIDRMVDKIYREVDQIFTTSPSFVKAITDRRHPVPKKKVHYWPQYAEEFYKPVDRELVREKAKKHLQTGEDDPVNLIPDDDSFKIIFTGNIGTAQGLEILPQAAEILKKTNPERQGQPSVRFIIVGDGRNLANFESGIRERRLEDAFCMIPRQPAEKIPELLACCDAAFLSFSDTKLWEMTIPAKLQSYMACGMPILAAAGGETKRIIEEAGCGVYTPIGDARALVDAIRNMVNRHLQEPSLIKTIEKNSRAYCEKYFEKEYRMDQMEKAINRYTPNIVLHR